MGKDIALHPLKGFVHILIFISQDRNAKRCKSRIACGIPLTVLGCGMLESIKLYNGTAFGNIKIHDIRSDHLLTVNGQR